MKFKIDPKAETENLPKIVGLVGEWGLISSLKKGYFKWSSEELSQEVKKLHKGNKKKFEKIKSYYEGYWSKIEKDYFKEMKKILGYKIDKDKTIYIVPSLYCNIADVLGRKNAFIVSAEIQQNPLDFLLLHELTHLYYADALIEYNLPKALESPLVEGVDHLILYKSKINKLFSSKKYEDDNFVKSNPEFMNKLEKAWNKRKDFKSFIQKAIKINESNKKEIKYY